MTREEAIRRIKAWNLDSDDMRVLAAVIPELRESEDERIRARLIEYFKGFLEGYEDCYKDGGRVKWEGLDVKSILAWLEKQKENANSFTDGVIEVRSFQRGMEEGRRLEGQKEQRKETLRDFIDNFPYSDEQKEHFRDAMKMVEQKSAQTVDEKEYIRAIKSLITDFVRETEPKDVAFYQRIYDWLDGRHIEQKPVEYLSKDKVYAIMSKLTKLSTSNLIPFNSPEYKKIYEITSDVRSLLDYPIEEKPVVTHGETYHVDTLGTQQVIAGKMPQKPAEWSKEDEEMLNSCICSIEESKENRYAYKENDGDTSYDREIAWLKSLRPVSKESLQPHWKPSENQMSMLLAVINDPNNAGSESCHLSFKSLYNELKKL